MQHNKEIKYFLSFLDLNLRDARDQLNARDALYGGRMDMFQMYFDSSSNPVFPRSTVATKRHHLKYAKVVSKIIVSLHKQIHLGCVSLLKSKSGFLNPKTDFVFL